SSWEEEMSILEDVDAQLGLYEADMAREFEGRMALVDNVLLEMEQRGHDFFDETMRIGRVLDLLNRSRVQEGFERRVVADAPQQIEKRVNELVDWLIDADFRQWQPISRHLARRRREFRDRIVGGVGEAGARPFNHGGGQLGETGGSAAPRA